MSETASMSPEESRQSAVQFLVLTGCIINFHSLFKQFHMEKQTVAFT